MRRTTRSSQYDPPRPIGQSFWLLSTMAIAVIIATGMSNAFSAQSEASEQFYSSQQLIDLANGETVETTTTTARANTVLATALLAAPTLSQADVRVKPDVDVDASDTTVTAPSTSTSTTAPPTPLAGTETTTTTETVAPPSTSSSTIAAPTSVDERGQAALDTISYPWQRLLPEWTITFHPEKNGLYGLTMVPEKKIEIYVRESQSTGLLAHVIAHELGHAVDVSLNDGPDRRRWADARGLASAPWWPGSGATDFSTGAGDFAESFAAWQVGDASFRSKLGGAPTAEQITLLAELSAS